MPRLLSLLPLILLAGCNVLGPIVDDPYAGRTINLPVSAMNGRTATGISAGFFHTCAVDNGQAYCAGANGYGQIGSSAVQACEAASCVTPAVNVTGAVSFARVYASTTHSCGLTGTGEAWCWGGPYPADSVGPVGGGGVQRSTVPVRVAGGLTFSALGVSIAQTCGLASDGVLYCWGRNWFGEVGDGSTRARREPVPVSSTLRFTAVSGGGSHHCGIDTDGRAHCWGTNQWGELGIGPLTEGNVRSTAPVPVQTTLTWGAISGGMGFTCALQQGTGAAYCWGDNRFGQLGAGVLSQYSATPIPVGAPSTFTAISAGASHACGLRANGEAWCWGSNYFGGLGAGGAEYSQELAPVRVQGHTFIDISAGGSHTCGVTTARTVMCWGDNFFKQHGNS